MRNGRVKAALRPHAVRSASATSVPGPKLPRRGHREVAKVPNPTPPSPSDTSEKCLDLPTLPLHVETRVVGALSALGDHHGSDAVERFLARVNALPEEDDAFAAELRAEAQAAAKEAVARLRGG